ncbi:MAG TPA: prepilin-type N-terminal cleavage/methylation domain-containing protein [Vicinamibacterales bacterium]|nr:prepilin-type N-terminal cleavage/methylation domain-containing protein [Vicinamibacterales bacterium]
MSGRPVDAFDLKDASGFSLIELMATMLLLVTLAAFVLPFTSTTLSAMNLSSDARNVAAATALAKMRAAAEFSKARIYVDYMSKTFWVERWQKTAPIGWVAEGVHTTLSSNVFFGYAGAAAPPPNTQAVIGQAPACLDNAGAAIAGSGCIVFNSRGVPIDAANVPTPDGAFYVMADMTIYGITTGAGGLIQLWQNNLVSNTWALK